MSNINKLVRMANQIARNFEIHGRAEACASTAIHIRKFWDPHMRKAILDHLATGGEHLSPIALEALKSMQDGDIKA